MKMDPEWVNPKPKFYCILSYQMQTPYIEYSDSQQPKPDWHWSSCLVLTIHYWEGADGRTFQGKGTFTPLPG